MDMKQSHSMNNRRTISVMSGTSKISLIVHRTSVFKDPDKQKQEEQQQTKHTKQQQSGVCVSVTSTVCRWQQQRTALHSKAIPWMTYYDNSFIHIYIYMYQQLWRYRATRQQGLERDEHHEECCQVGHWHRENLLSALALNNDEGGMLTAGGNKTLRASL